MPLHDICALPVHDLVTSDSVLFMWSIVPHLEQAFDVLNAWGFQYVSHLCWVKDRPAQGYWARNQHELLLIARRGDVPAPNPPPASVIAAARREHSRKPDEAYEIIEQMFPGLPKLELFARGGREGWAAWGNEVDIITEGEST